MTDPLYQEPGRLTTATVVTPGEHQYTIWSLKIQQYNGLNRGG